MNRPQDMNLKLAQVADWLNGARLVGDGAVTVQRVHSDTRSLQPGDLFVALRGERFDAVDFLPQARAAGAVAALCDAAAAERLAASGLPGVLVPDARLALGQLGARWRAQVFAGPLIAVTGSNGKTTVTQLLSAMLQAWQGAAALATAGNLNNDIGVPLTLLRLRQQHRVAVLELGMNHPGEIEQLAAMARPTVALVNNAQREHLEFMGTVQAVARENGAVLASLPDDGVAVFPVDDAHTPLWQQLAGQRRQLLFGPPEQGGQVFVREALWQGGAWQLRVGTPEGELNAALQVPGRHNLHNALAAVACAQAAGVPLEAIAAGLAAFRPVTGRSRTLTLRRGGRSIALVDDSYNANPDSVRALIDWLAELPGPRLLVLGDMGEVGEQGAALHAEIGSYARAKGIEHLLAHGALAIHAAMASGGRHFEHIEQLVAAVRTHLGHCASVAVKGSRFMRMERVVEALTDAPEHKEKEGGRDAA